MSSQGDSSAAKTCCFCGLTENNELKFGKFYEHDGIVTHYYCLLLSSNMEQKGDDDQGILGFLAIDIQKELRRGKRLVCSYCKKAGATLGCCNTKCKKIFHYPCGLGAGSLHQFFGEFRSFCINHRPKQKIDDHVKKELNEAGSVMCYICYDIVNPHDFVDTLWAPCCKKNAWFHRRCVQQLAMSAGYFFKCPLCNNKKDFQEAMLECGIFIPSQDASWELVPNAFQELLYRHDQCDAVECFCPKGRKHTSSNAKWELALCRTCGSQGIHMACGQLKWANPIWECVECTAILRKSKQATSSGTSTDVMQSNSDSDSDISVGTDDPAPIVSYRPAPSPERISLPIKLRPGPRSYKLQQQRMAHRILVNSMQLKKEEVQKVTYSTTSEKRAQDAYLTESNSVSTHDSSPRSKEDRVPSNHRSKSCRGDEDVIMIDSDDDIIEIISHKSSESHSTSSNDQPEVQGPSQASRVSPSLEEVSVKSSDSYGTVDLQRTDASNGLSRNNCAVENLDATTDGVVDRLDTALLQDVSNCAARSELLHEQSECTKEDSVMNIKIVNVTSLSPEVFANVSSEDEDWNNTPPSKSPKSVETPRWKTIDCDNSTPLSSGSETNLKRKPDNTFVGDKVAYPLTTTVTDRFKKVRGEKFERMDDADMTQSNEKSAQDKTLPVRFSSASNAVPCTSVRPKRQESLPIVFNRLSGAIPCTSVAMNVHIDSNSSKCESIGTSVLDRAQEDIIEGKDCDIALECTKSKNLMCTEKSNSEIGRAPTIAVSSNIDSTRSSDTEDEEIFSVQPVPDPPPLTDIINSEVKEQKPLNSYCTPLDSLTSRWSANQTMLSNKKEYSKNVPKEYSSSENNCDGDAGTDPAAEPECCSTSNGAAQRRPRALTKTNFYLARKSIRQNNRCAGIIPVPSCSEDVGCTSVFSEVTNNRNACDRPRLIPEYVRLHDLKFSVCDSDNVEMILYDTFSVNITVDTATQTSGESDVSTRKTRSESSKGQSEISTARHEGGPRNYDRINTITEDASTVPCIFNSEICKYTQLGEEFPSNKDDAKENMDPVATVSYRSTEDIVNYAEKKNSVEQIREDSNKYKYLKCVSSVRRQNVHSLGFDQVSSSTVEAETDSYNSMTVECTMFSKDTDSCMESKTANKVGSCFRVSIDLSKIRGLIDANPNLFQKYKRESDRRLYESIDFLGERNNVTEKTSRRSRHIARSKVNGTRNLDSIKFSSKYKTQPSQTYKNNEKHEDTAAEVNLGETLSINSARSNQKRGLKRTSRHFESQCTVDR